MNNNRKKEPKQESGRAKRDMERVTGEPFVERVIKTLEKQRKKLREKNNHYTQKYVAEKAGISYSAYKGYVSGRSHHIDLITAKNLANVLGLCLSEVIKEAGC